MKKLDELFKDNEVEVKVDRYKDLFKETPIEEGELDFDIE